MKIRFLVFAALLVAASGSVKAQIQKGNVIVGGDIAGFDLGLSKGSTFDFNLNPKAAWFIRDNVAVGAYGDFGLITAKHAGTTVTYGIGALGRYYISDPKLDVVKHLRFFAEGNIGIEGKNVDNSGLASTTNGLGLGIGPGAAYFITPSVSLEGLLKYQGIIGFGNKTTTSDLVFSLGLGVYLPTKKLKQAVHNQQ
jgi:hypothetical protein